MRRRERGGLAAIADALVFLAVAIIVSLALSSAYVHQGSQELERTDLASRAHGALLGCEVRIETSGTVTPSMSISSLVVMMACSDDRALEAGIQEKASEILSAILPSSVSFEWTLTCQDEVRLSCGEVPDRLTSLYSSAIVLSSAKDIRSHLVLWI